MAVEIWIRFSSEADITVQEAVKLINAAQNSWLLRIDSRFPIGTVLSAPQNPHTLASEVGESTLKRPLIYITHESFTDNWFSHEFKNISVISLYGINSLDIGFPLVAYLIYQIVQSLISFTVKENERDLFHLFHDPAIGCLFDFCSYKPDIRLGMAASGLCSKCYAVLLEMGVSEIQLQNLTCILNVVAKRSTNSVNKTHPQNRKQDMLSILHISDLHFGKAFRFQPKMIKSGPPPVFEPFGSVVNLADLLISDLMRISVDPQMPPDIRLLASHVDIVIISGDIANSGGRDKALPLRSGGPTDEYEQAAEFVISLMASINDLRQKEALPPLDIKERLIAVPGNHDVNWDEPPDSPDRFIGFAKFWRRVTGSRAYFDCPPNEIFARTLIEVDGTSLAIFGFNSCTVTAEPIRLREIGLVENAQLNFCENSLRGFSQEPDRKIAIFHHHPLYIPSLAAGIEDYDAMLQAGKILSYLQSKQFDLILHGHKHYPMAWVHNMIAYEAPAHRSWSEPVIVSSGSLSADNLPSLVPNTYQLIGIRKKKDPLRPVCTVIRRKFLRGDMLYGARFEPDGVFQLGHDSLSPTEREKRLELLPELASPVGQRSSLHEERAKHYKESAGWMLVHRYRASNSPDQEYDISIYLIEKKGGKRKEIEYVLYAVGDMWAGSPFMVSTSENGFELKLSAYGPFLCIAEVHFKEGGACRHERFIDFEMANI